MEEKETRFDRSTERSECLIAEYKKLRKDEAKMSQKSLEDITGVPRQMIIRYEKGKIMPTVRAMNRLLEPLGYPYKNGGCLQMLFWYIQRRRKKKKKRRILWY